MSPARPDSLLPGAWAGPAGSTGLPDPGAGLRAPAADGSGDPLNTVGLALLAYGLVQLLSKVVDRLPIGRAHPDAPPGGGFTADDRKRLERSLEITARDHERLERMAEEVREIHEYTRWATEQRHRVDARDGEPIWQCRARGVSDQLAVNQRLIGQALDELRSIHGKLDNALRKLRALWLRVGRRRGDER